MTTAEQLENYHQLCHQADLAAYAVLGVARVLFCMVNDEAMKKDGLECIAAYDAARAKAEKALVTT